MESIAVQIIKYVDNAFPGWVECRFYDAAGACHSFIEKAPVVSLESLDAGSQYPRHGTIACQVVVRWAEQDGRSLARIDTSRPWSIESSQGLTEFVVASSMLLPPD